MTAKRADQLVAETWRLSRGQQAQDESVLEAALAAAFEYPEFWPRLARHLGWTLLPTESPTVSTQDVVPGGRTDITLSWPSKRRLVFELKVWDHPTVEQIKTYLDAGADVVAVAALYGTIDVTVPAGRRFLGVVTWRQIHAVVKAWPEAPLVGRQLAALLEQMGVAMPKLSLSALQGVVSSWDAWATLDEWIHKATSELEKTFTKGGWRCVRKDEPKHHVKIYEDHSLYAGWTWPPRWNQDERLGFYAGVRMNRPEAPLLIEGVPDLILALHVNPNHAHGKLLRSDIEFLDAVKVWRARTDPPTVRREWDASETTWSILRVRASSVELLHAEDQGECFVSWMTERAQELVEDGVIARLAVLRPPQP